MDKTFDDFMIGDSITFEKIYTARDFKAFAKLSGDFNPLHWDKAYAANASFEEVIVPIHMAAAPVSAIAGMVLPGHRSLILRNDIHGLLPVPYGRKLTYSAKIAGKHPSSQSLDIQTILLDGTKVLLESQMSVRVRDDLPEGVEAPLLDPIANIRKPSRPGMAVITGASGSIGSAIAINLARQGWDLLLHGNSRSLDGLAERCRTLGIAVQTVVASLNKATERKRLAGLVSEVDADAIVHTASPSVNAPLTQLMDVNFAVFSDLSEAALPAMLRKQDGRIVFLGSSAVQSRPVGWDNYVAAKNAAMNFAATLNSRYARYGVRTTSIAPSAVDTAFLNDLSVNDKNTLIPEEVAELVVDQVNSDNGCMAECILQQPGRISPVRLGLIDAHMETVTPSKGPDGDQNTQRTASVVDHSAKQGVAESVTARLINSYLKLPEDNDLLGGGLGMTPNWDSLRHIELVTHLESQLNISFTSQEISAAIRFEDILALVDQKLGNL